MSRPGSKKLFPENKQLLNYKMKRLKIMFYVGLMPPMTPIKLNSKIFMVVA